MSEPTHTYEIWTPAQAEQALLKNEVNRVLRPSKVEQYARDMSNGNWGHSVILFDAEGRMIDGQHRLHAQLKAGVNVKYLIVRNLPPETQKFVDTGINRSVADILH